MHEASLMTDLIRKIMRIAHEQCATKVLGVYVTLGAWSHMSPDHLRMHFAQAIQGTMVEGARLEIDVRPETDQTLALESLLDRIEVEV